MNVTIQKQTYTLADKYAEGHTLSANEAAALNQLRAENLRNNFASTVKKALGEDGTGTPPSQEAFDTFAEAYAFGVRRVGTRTGDPVAREAKRIATDKVHAAVKAKYGKLDAVDKAQLAKTIDDLAVREDIVALARQNVEAANEIAGDLDLGEL